MIVQICGASDPGRERHNNEDSIALDDEAGFGIVADGMGGHNAGEVASGMAVAYISSELRSGLAQFDDHPDIEQIKDVLRESVAGANRAIYNMSQASSQYKGMGTTLVLAVLHAPKMIVCHLGDSRCYRVHDGAIEQITRDHSVIQEQVDAGLITIEQSLSAAMQNLVTRALGVAESVTPDIYVVDVAVGDLFLLCSDGLTDMVPENELTEILSQEIPLSNKVAQLIETANNHGGVDNVSAVLCLVVETPPKSGLFASAGKALKGVLRRKKKSS